MIAWSPQTEPMPVRVSGLGWVLALARGLMLGVALCLGLAIVLVFRIFERPLAGHNRPISPFVTQGVCRAGLFILGLRYAVRGEPMRHRGAVVANHSSWIDIFALNACQRVYFVSKAEVAGWPGIGWLAKATGTVFIERNPKKAKAQQGLFESRIRAGHKLLFFPEGTSTDGLRVLPFKSTLFAAFFTHGMESILIIQPVSVIYRSPQGRDSRFYGWWGDTNLASHLLLTLAQWHQGGIEVVFHDPVSVADFQSRKDLAAYCEAAVRDGLDHGLPSHI